MVVLLVVGAAAFGAKQFLHKDQPKNTANSEQKETVNYDPPTPEESKAGDSAKDKVIEQEKTDQQPTPSQAKVIITYGSQYDGRNIEVGAYVSNLFEDGGTCTLNATKDGVTRSSTVNAVKSANSTDCPMMSIERSQLMPGTWQTNVTYKSSTASGTSDSRQIEVK